MLDFLYNLFQKKEAGSKSKAMDEVFTYLQSISPSPDITYQYITEYQSYKRGSRGKFDSRIVHLYLIWEEFLVTNTQMNPNNQKTQQDIRTEISKKINVSLLNEQMGILFTPPETMALLIYEIFIQDIAQYIIQNSGIVNLKQTLTRLNRGTFFESVTVTGDGLDFTEFNKKQKVNALGEKELAQAFKGLYTILYNIITSSFGGKIASSFFNTIYKKLQATYNQEIAGIFLRVIPEDVLGFDDWLSTLSKTELERQVKNKTSELENLNNSLELKVKERTQELEKAYMELKVLDQKKSEFISVAAHQLRTPLSGLKWTIGMFLDNELGEINAEQRDFLKRGYSTNEHMISIVNDLLNTDLIAQGKAEYTFEDIDIYGILENALFQISTQATKKNISFEKPVVIESVRNIVGDSKKIELVLLNLLDNAVKYSPENTLVKISFEKDGGNIKIRVKDAGIGIPTEQQNSIFERFYRARNAIRTHADGSGLGLFITKNVIEKHGGTIYFDSEENKGTTFIFTLPIKQALKTISKTSNKDISTKTQKIVQ